MFLWINVFSIFSYTNINICGNLVNNNDDFNEWMNTLLYKNISLTLYSQKGWCWLCVRGELETVDGLLYWTQVLLTIAALLPHLGLDCSTAGHWGLQALSLQADSHAGILSPTDSNSNWNWPKLSVAPGYIIVSHPPNSAVPLLIYSSASLDWRLGRGSIYNNCVLLHSVWFESHTDECKFSGIYALWIPSAEATKNIYYVKGKGVVDPRLFSS